MREILKNLYGITEYKSLDEKEFAFLENKFGAIPGKLREFYSLCGHCRNVIYGHDNWIMPDEYMDYRQTEKDDSGNMVIFSENQGVCRAVILKEDLVKDDPPVYIIDGSEESPYLSTDDLEDFIKSSLVYEFVMSTYEKISELAKADYDKVCERLEKLPFSFNWGSRLYLFKNAPDSAAVVVEISEEKYYLLFGAANPVSYDKISAVLDGIGTETML